MYRKIVKIWILIFGARKKFEPLGGLFGLKIGMRDHLHGKDAATSQFSEPLGDLFGLKIGMGD